MVVGKQDSPFIQQITGIKWYNSIGKGALCVSESPHAKLGTFSIPNKTTP